MLTKGLGLLAVLVLLCGIAAPVWSAGNLVVTGQTVLTKANVPAAGFTSIAVLPGGELTILTPIGQPPLTINVRDFVAIAGLVRVLAVSATLPPAPTPHGGAVVFNLPAGTFAVGPTGAVNANVRNGEGLPLGKGGAITVKADTIDIAGLLNADGSMTNLQAYGGLIDLVAGIGLTVENPEMQTTGTLAALSAKGYLGGIIRLRTLTGAVTLADTSLIDVRGITGRPFTTSDLLANASLIVIEAGNSVVLGGFRLYGVDRSATGIGHLYVATKGPISMNPIPEVLLQVTDFAEYAELADTNLGTPSNHFAAILLTATHLGDVLFRANYNGPLEITAANAAIIEDARLASCLTVKVNGYLLLLDSRLGQSASITASRIQKSNVVLPAGAVVNETLKPVSFAGDTFAAGEVYSTPCGLKLTGGKIGAGAKIACEGPLALTGVEVGNNVTLEAGKAWAIDFTRSLPFAAEILKITGGEMGNDVLILATRPPDCAANKALTGAITGTEFGENLRLELAGSLKATGIEVEDACDLWIAGDIKFTGGDFGTGAIHYTGAKKCTGTKDQDITYTNSF